MLVLFLSQIKFYGHVFILCKSHVIKFPELSTLEFQIHLPNQKSAHID